MAAHAGGNTTFGITTTVDSLSQFDQFGVSRSVSDFLAGKVSGQVCAVLFRQIGYHTFHDLVVTFAIGEILQLLDEIACMLPAQFWPFRVNTVAINTVTGGTAGGLGLSGLRITLGLDRCECYLNK